jgi:hypothetical protein
MTIEMDRRLERWRVRKTVTLEKDMHYQKFNQSPAPYSTTVCGTPRKNGLVM